MTTALPREVRQAYADYWSLVPWDVFATLELPRPVSQFTAESRWNDRLDVLQRRVRHRVGYLLVAEMAPATSTRSRVPLHLHVLIAGTGGLDPSELARIWKGRVGNARVERYDPSLGAAWYLMKWLERAGCWYDFANLGPFLVRAGR